MKTVKMLGGVVLIASCATAFKFDLSTVMRLKAMERQFTEDHIDDDQKVALMEVAGFGDMELFMSKQITASDFKESMMQEMKDRMITQILQGGGIDISNPIWRRTFFADRDDAELFTESMAEPMQSIIRLSRDSSSVNSDYGKELLKKLQFKQFNKKGSYLTENFDEVLLSDDKSATIKQILKQQMLASIADPIDRAMMYQLQQQKDTTDSAEKAKLSENIKDLQTIKIFQGSVPKVSPVTPDQLYTFYQITNGGHIAGADILNVALGESLGPISELDFERYFGSPAKQFSCRAHQSRIKVPCGVNPTANECLAAGCCYKPDPDAGIPNCYHDLYGKIGSAILRRSYVKSDPDKEDAISSLFVDGRIPTLDKILRYDTPFGVSLNSNDGLSKIGLNAVKYETTNWWDSSKVVGEDGVEAVFTKNEATRPRYGRPDFKWKPHGPTQSPYFDEMPGINPTAAPGSGYEDLNQYYKMWLSYAAAQDEAQCALINPTSRIKCMENYEALVDAATGGNVCKTAGCCFNEDSFLEGNHACYRAQDYGTCIDTEFPPEFIKRECGYEGITEKQCLTNPRCCYYLDYEVTGAPACFYKYSHTIDESEWCTAWNLIYNKDKDRKECFATGSKTNMFTADKNTISNINNLVSKEQCLAADCCYDETLSYDAIEWIQQGLGQTTELYRCFKKENPAIYSAMNIIKYQELTEAGLENPHDYEIKQKTCTVGDWHPSLTFKRSCGENLSYFQCVYNNRCCYRATTSNEPVCYHPELEA